MFRAIVEDIADFLGVPSPLFPHVPSPTYPARTVDRASLVIRNL